MDNDNLDEIIDSTIVDIFSQKDYEFFYNSKHEDFANKHLQLYFLDIVVEALKSCYQVNISGENIKQRFDALVSKFKIEYRKVTAYVPSGSSSKRYESTWLFYNQMEFLIPHLEHCQDVIDTLNDDQEIGEQPGPSTQKPVGPPLDRFAKKKQKDNDELSQKIINTVDNVNLALEKLSGVPDKPQDTEGHSDNAKAKVIQEEFCRVPEEEQTDLMIELLSCIAQHKQKKGKDSE